MKEFTVSHEAVYSGDLLLVNAQMALKEGDSTNLQCIDPKFPDILLKTEAANALREALCAINAQDRIVPVSGYRSLAEQTELYETSLAENGTDFTQKYVALPNHSEHQTGLAIDLGQKIEPIDFLRPDFSYEGICGAFRAIAARYGFVERYPKGCERITGIAHEPWHFRYVGCPHAQIMEENALVMEQYHTFVKRFRSENPFAFHDGESTGFIFYASEGERVVIPDGFRSALSGNYIDGVIVTMRRVSDG